jgi:hypothetical protein
MRTLLLTLISTVALAASPHFVGTPTITAGQTTLRATGKIAGLGNGDVTVVLNADGIASVQCRNHGGNVAPGQDTAVSVAGSVTLASPKNGNLPFAVETVAPVVGSDACPNDNWSAEVLSVAFSGGVLTVLQGGVVVLSFPF